MARAAGGRDDDARLPGAVTRAMPARTATSAGILLFRRRAWGLEVFLAHPGGPFWAKREAGAWTIPKGVVGEGEELLDAARRELREETGLAPEGPFIALGSIKQKAGKTVYAWACEGDADPSTVTSNDTRVEWPRGSGKWLVHPEVDRCQWFTVDDARTRINPAQAELLDRLALAASGSGDQVF
jgi:predicted NUDIX family NTP pyrophosphohydrolase